MSYGLSESDLRSANVTLSAVLANREITMSADDEYKHSVRAPGQETTKTLAEVLGVTDDNSLSEQLRIDLNEVRKAELRAERAASTIRLY